MATLITPILGVCTNMATPVSGGYLEQSCFQNVSLIADDAELVQRLDSVQCVLHTLSEGEMAIG